MDANNLEIVY